MDANLQIALESLHVSDRKSPRPDNQHQEPSDDAANANPQQHIPATQPNRRRVRKPRTRIRNRTLDQTIAGHDKSAPQHENKKQAAVEQPAGGIQKPRGRRARKERFKSQLAKKTLTEVMAALEDVSLTAPQTETKCTTRSMTHMLPLGFDNSYLLRVGDASRFMHNDGIRTWIGSVSHHLKSWYTDCVCDPANTADLLDAQNSPMQFATSVAQEECMVHNSAVLPGGIDEGTQVGKVTRSFVQHTALVSRRIQHDGQRNGAFLRCKNIRSLRYAAIMLLVSVMMDLTVNMGYFIRLFLGIHDADLTKEDEQILLALGGASTDAAQPLQYSGGIGAALRTLQVPAGLFDSVSKTFESLPQSTGCRLLVHPPSGPGLGRNIVLIGSAEQMDEAEQVIMKVVEASASPSGMVVS